MPRLHRNGRAIHPAVRASSLLHWELDETSGDAVDLVSGVALTALGAIPTPAIANSPTGRARRFTATEILAEATTGVYAGATMEGDWTAGCTVRFTDAPGAGNEYVLAYGGDSSDSSSAMNYLLAIYRDTDGGARWFWENGTGTNVNPTSTSGHEFYTDEWTYVVVRKSNSTGSGAAGTADVDLFVNGTLVESWVGVQNCDGGTSARWQIGGLFTAGGSSDLGSPSEIAGAYIWAEALEDSDIQDDMRRLQLTAFPTVCHPEVQVEYGDAGFEVSLSDYEGRDWLQRASYKYDIDDAVATMSATFTRDVGNLSIAPLRDDARANFPDPTDLNSPEALVDVGQPVTLKVARLPLFVDPQYGNSDFSPLLSGSIDRVSFHGDAVTITARDKGGHLVDTYIEDEATYGSSGGTQSDSVIESILTASSSTNKTGSYTDPGLVVPVPLNFLLKPYRQRREPVMSAIRTIAGATAGDCKYIYDHGVGDFKLSYYEPRRLRPCSDFVISNDDILSITDATLDKKRMRTVVRVAYPSSETSQPATPSNPDVVKWDVTVPDWYGVSSEGDRLPSWVQWTNLTALDRFKRMFFEISEASTSQIDTIDEASRMAFGIAIDLSEPDFYHTIVVPCLFEMTINDMALVLANRRLYTSDQRLATKSLSHEFNATARTTIQMRGKPAVGNMRWLSVEARPGIATPPVINPDDSRTDQFSRGRLANFQTLMSSTDTGAAGRFTKVRNNSFTSSQRGRERFAPDGWALTGADTWRTEIESDESESLEGDTSIRIASEMAGELESDLVAVEEGQPYAFEIAWKPANGTGDTLPTYRVDYYEADKTTLVSSTTIPTAVPAGWAIGNDFPIAGDWIRSRLDSEMPPADARHFRLCLTDDTTTTFRALNIDNVASLRAQRVSPFLALNLTDTSAAADTWEKVIFDGTTGSAKGIDAYNGSPPAGRESWSFQILEDGRYELRMFNESFVANAGCTAFKIGISDPSFSPTPSASTPPLDIAEWEATDEHGLIFEADAGQEIVIVFKSIGGTADYRMRAQLRQVSGVA